MLAGGCHAPGARGGAAGKGGCSLLGMGVLAGGGDRLGGGGVRAGAPPLGATSVSFEGSSMLLTHAASSRA